MTDRPVVELQTFAEVCALLRKTPAAGRWLMQTGDFPKMRKIGGRLMARSIDVEAYLKAKFDDAA